MQVSRLQEKSLKQLREYLELGSNQEKFQVCDVGERMVTRNNYQKILDASDQRMNETKKKVKEMNDQPAKTIAIGHVPIAFWIFVAYGEGESGPIDWATLSELANIQNGQIYSRVHYVKETGVVVRASGSKFARGNGNISISGRSLEREVKVGDIIFERGESYNLAQIADEYRTQPGVAGIIKRLTTVKASKRGSNGVSKRAKAFVSHDISQGKTVAAMLKQLSSAVSFLSQAGDFDFGMLSQALAPEEILALRKWVNAHEPEVAAASSMPDIKSDFMLDKCLETIRRICFDSCQIVASLRGNKKNEG